MRNLLLLALVALANGIYANDLQFLNRPESSLLHPTGFRISWSTNLPTSAVVWYGNSPDPDALVWVAAQTNAQSIDLEGLQPGTIYWVRIGAIHTPDTLFSETLPFVTQSLSTGQIKVFFNHSIDLAAAGGWQPDGDSYQAVLAETIARINSAQQTIDVAMYNNNRSDITAALTQAHQRGVRVRYVAAMATDNSALSSAPPFPVLYGNEDALMHDKFMSIDADLDQQAWVMSGSLNWTSSNIINDFNNTLFIQDQSLARAYELEFEEMWGSTGATFNLANSRFGSAKTDNTPHHFLIAGVPAEVWFSPSDKVTQRIVDAIHTANNKASFAIFSFTKNEIGNAFIDQHEAGAWVRGMMENINDPGAELDWLLNNGVSIAPHPGNYLLHHKYAVVDAGTNSDPLVATGSHNWTNAAENSNDENTLILHDERLAFLYQAEFEARWSETTTGAQEEQRLDVDLFPNPAIEVITLRLNDFADWGGVVEIRDLWGRLLQTETLASTSTIRIPVAQWPAGTYLLTLITDRGSAAFSFQTISN
ncbi:MAG: T9SS type A sorting domain-containing protein [Saprospiraceae bacterium]|nr:T9SS type A sorting domain-containing protein [Saprospiraceae bacterium]